MGVLRQSPSRNEGLVGQVLVMEFASGLTGELSGIGTLRQVKRDTEDNEVFLCLCVTEQK